jgi:hypothetical protein
MLFFVYLQLLSAYMGGSTKLVEHIAQYVITAHACALPCQLSRRPVLKAAYLMTL